MSAKNNAATKILNQDDPENLFASAKNAASVFDFSPAAKDLEKVSNLKPLFYVLNNGLVFCDRQLPPPTFECFPDTDKLTFSKDYYVDLHFKVAAFKTYNHLGARIPLNHSPLNIKKFRELSSPDYDDMVVIQYMEFGFPLGLQEDFVLSPVLKNHSSSYEYFNHVDKFIKTELEKGGVTGPFLTSPYNNIMVSPLMTSPKKPNSRRTVSDVSSSDFSLNLNTPEKVYLGDDYTFSFPKVDDFARLILYG